MPYQALPEFTDELDQLQARLRSERDPERKRRLHMLVLFMSQPTITRLQVADHLAVHRNTVTRWLSRYQHGGLEALLTEHPPGRHPGQRALPEPVYEALQERLKDPEGFAGYDHIQQWLREEFALDVPYQTVYGLVHYRLKAKLKVPRPEHPKKA